jgi:hypothetical protein
LSPNLIFHVARLLFDFDTIAISEQSMTMNHDVDQYYY